MSKSIWSLPSSSSSFRFAYTTSPAAVMHWVVFFRSSKRPYNFGWSEVTDGHCAIRSGWCMLHFWRTCSVALSSSPQGHVGGKEWCLVSCTCVESANGWLALTLAQSKLHSIYHTKIIQLVNVNKVSKWDTITTGQMLIVYVYIKQSLMTQSHAKRFLLLYKWLQK